MPVTRKSENMRDVYFPNMQPIQEKCNQAPTNEGDVQPNHELPLPIRAPLFILLLFFLLTCFPSPANVCALGLLLLHPSNPGAAGPLKPPVKGPYQRFHKDRIEVLFFFFFFFNLYLKPFTTKKSAESKKLAVKLLPQSLSE